jgi:hypothetical protein
VVPCRARAGPVARRVREKVPRVRPGPHTDGAGGAHTPRSAVEVRQALQAYCRSGKAIDRFNPTRLPKPVSTRWVCNAAPERLRVCQGGRYRERIIARAEPRVHSGSPVST